MDMSKSLALLSVSNKTEIVTFARGLVDAGFEILSTGGTAAVLAKAGVGVTLVSDYTGHLEIMEGRVKTLHPKVHGGILGVRSKHQQEADENGIGWIDLVAVNLYPFEATIAKKGVTVLEAIEQIDIGGPSMVRSAAKNHHTVTVVTDPSDYGAVLQKLSDSEVNAEFRRDLAVKAFRHTAVYDSIISSWLSAAGGVEGEKPSCALLPFEQGLPLRKVQDLRYGENPHQKAAFYGDPVATGRSLARAKQIQGKQLSFNNLADLDATVRIAFDLKGPGCAIVKHMNPCGAAEHSGGLAMAFGAALSGDPVSAYGGIVAFNQRVDADTVRALRKSRTFFEVLAAPGFTAEAVELLAPRDKMRVLDLPLDWASARPSGMDARRVMGGWLLQDWDMGADMDWNVTSNKKPNLEMKGCLDFAWRMCRHVKSNAIVLAESIEGGFRLNGVGAGQMSRVDSVKLALSKATSDVSNCVLASDAFFPFPDAVEVALSAGIGAFIQPGGSIRDDKVVAKVDGKDGVMVMTGCRHFRH